MARLTRLAPQVPGLASRFARRPETEAERSRRRDAETEARRWYKTAAWQRLRWRTLVRDGFQCQMPGCSRVHADTSRLVCDHIEPHRGDADRFWDASNLQTLCKSPCHDQWKQREERRNR